MVTNRGGNSTPQEAYCAIAERNGRGWAVRVEGLPTPARFHARDLSDIKPRALRLIWGYTGAGDRRIGLDVQIQLPPATQLHLELIRKLYADIEVEHNAAIVEMAELGLPLVDISRVLTLHRHLPRPLTVSNAELAENGLDRHPDAVGVEGDDHGFALTRTCRRHVDSTRRSYRDAEPDGLNALVYTGIEFRCDLCHEGDDSAN